jgi:hypothetical protein
MWKYVNVHKTGTVCWACYSGRGRIAGDVSALRCWGQGDCLLDRDGLMMARFCIGYFGGFICSHLGGLGNEWP